MAGLLLFGLAGLARAGNPQRIGHTTLLPRHSNPDDSGMYAAAIDATNGYAYFMGLYLFKLDLAGNLPVQVGPASMWDIPSRARLIRRRVCSICRAPR